MSAIDTAAIRAALERTGALATRHDDDPGHITDFWRKRIAALLDAIESGDAIAEPVADDDAVREVESFIHRVRTALFAELPAERLARAVWLIEEAAPRMRNLNNPAGDRWTKLAQAFLAGEKP